MKAESYHHSALIPGHLEMPLFSPVPQSRPKIEPIGRKDARTYEKPCIAASTPFYNFDLQPLSERRIVHRLMLKSGGR
jgi:hypothetical protein